MEIVVAPILALLIALWGFSMILRSVFGGGGVPNFGGLRTGGTGFVGQLFLGLMFSVVLPVVWWTIALVGRMYHRTFVVFTEFLTGVHDWGTYRTSSLKYGGVCLAFMGFNGLLFLVLNLLVSGTAGPGMSASEWAAALGGTAGCSGLARAMMRRMP